MMFVKMVLLSITRRKREIRFVSIVTFIAVLFLSGVSLFQNVMNRYLMETNYKNYGEWVFASLEKELSHPYFASSGSCKTGAVVLNEKGEQIAESVGCIDEGFLQFANLTFYEGRLPEKDDEIVMNLTTLAKLGYSFDLGQTIHIQVQKETEILENDMILVQTETFEKEFTLVGTVRDFSNSWRYVDGYPLASCIITEEALKQLGGSLYTTHFYQLDRIYEGIDKDELQNAFIEPGVVVFNNYVYDNTVWGTQEMFSDMQDSLILVAVLMLSYLMMSYVSKRRSWYYKLRCTGAGKPQIWAMIFIEGLYATLPWAAAGFVVSYGAGAVICGIVSARNQLPTIFVIDGTGLLTQVVWVAGIILLALLAACLGTSDQRLSNNASEVTKGQLRRLRRAARGKKNTARHFLKRQDIRHPWQKAAMMLCTVVVSTILASCMFVIFWKYDHYQLVVGNKSDFSAYKGEYGDGTTYTVWEEDIFGELKKKEIMYSMDVLYYAFDNGVNEQLEKELEAIEGIANIETYLMELESYLEWEGQENSHPYLLAYERSKRDNFVTEEELWRYVKDVMMFRMYVDTYEDLQKKYKVLFENANIDEEAFLNGEQMIVFFPSTEETYMNEVGESSELFLLEESTLTNGMDAVWKNDQMGVELSVNVCVPSLTEEQLEEMGIGGSTYYVFASKGFAERVAAELGTQMEYNNLDIDFEPNTAFSSTTKRLAATLVKHGFEYDVEWEWKAMARDEFYNALCVYGTLFCMVTMIYLVLQMNVNQMKHYHRGRQYWQLKRLGMSDAFFLWLHIKQGIKDALWLLSGVFLGYIVYICVKEPLILHPSETGALVVVSPITGEHTSEPIWVILEYIRMEFQWEHFAIIFSFFAAMIALDVIIVAHTAKKSMLEER